MLVSVDLPIPGEPPSSRREPGTRPPPSTRSSSPIPVDMRFTGAIPTSLSGRGASLGPGTAALEPPRRPRRPPARASLPVTGASGSSTSVFHASHPGHWPCHWADCKPHCVQLWMVLRGIRRSLRVGGDAARPPQDDNRQPRRPPAVQPWVRPSQRIDWERDPRSLLLLGDRGRAYPGVKSYSFRFGVWVSSAD